jgi:hypothetical protein
MFGIKIFSPTLLELCEKYQDTLFENNSTALFPVGNIVSALEISRFFVEDFLSLHERITNFQSLLIKPPGIVLDKSYCRYFVSLSYKRC